MSDKLLAVYLTRHLEKLRIAISDFEQKGIDTASIDEVAADLIDDIEVLKS